MIVFKRRSFLDSIKRLSPAYRRKQDAATKDAIRWLVQNPSAPCQVDGYVIPDGYGNDPLRREFWGL